MGWEIEASNVIMTLELLRGKKY